MLFLLLVGFLCILLLFLQRHDHSKRTLYPPGPEGSFFAGVRDQLSSTPWKTYAQWAEYYKSPIISFWVYNRRTIVLNDHKTVRELLERRANIYSDRPKSWMYHELCNRGKSVFNISSLDSRHGKYRRLLRNELSGRAIREYHSLLEDQADVFVQSLTNEPQAFQQHLRRNAAAVIMKVAYGYTIAENHDPFVGVAEEAAKISGWALAPGRWIVDYYPVVRFLPSWFPFAGFKRQGEKWKQQLESLSDVPHAWAKTQLARGDFAESFTSRLLRPNGTDFIHTEEEDIVKWTAGGLYAGASDTTVSALTSFILLMALYPDVQRQAQREIDGLSGGAGRIPSITEVHSLTYLNALYKEVLRYAPVSNIAIPHRVTQDDVYQSYRIPKDSTVIANTWAILHDFTLFPDPFQFNPGRFIEVNNVDSNPDPRSYVFGYGRRSCPGLQFAEVSILLIMSRVLSRFEISLPIGADAPRIEFTPGITSHIKPFDVIIEPRL